MSSSAAMMSMGANKRAVAAMASQRTSTSAKAAPGLRAAKNNADHRALSTSCAANSAKAAGAPEKPARSHTSHAAVAIMAKSRVHTGANSHEGGVHDGLLMSAYQSASDGVVNSDPSAATPKHTATAPSSASAFTMS